MMLSDFVKSLTSRLITSGRNGTCKSYHSTLRSILKHYGKDVRLDTVCNSDWLSDYQSRLLLSGCCWNTVSFYMRVLQSICNQAADQELISFSSKVFKDVYTRNDPTVKRAVGIDAIQLICDADLPAMSQLSYSRDLFMLSFYLHGISFVDMAFLKKKNLKNGVLTYHRRKTNSPIVTPVSQDALKILHKYAFHTRHSPYLLPIILKPGMDEYRQYTSALRSHNRRLNQIASIIGINENLTSYVARHSWATNAKSVGVTTPVISQALGHRTEEVTRIYLATFNLDILTDANRVLSLALSKMRDKSDRKISKDVRLYRREGRNLLQK